MLKEVKRELAELGRKISAISADIKKMEAKRVSVSGLVTSLETSLKSAQGTYQEAIRSFARDEINETELNKASKIAAELEAQVSTQQAVFKVVEDDLVSRKEEYEGICKQQRARQGTAWGLIANAEIAKLSGPLRRAFAACRKRGLYSDHRSFSYHIVENHLFVGDEVFDRVAEDLAREYLG
jgi:chromosome segregation ATPase